MEILNRLLPCPFCGKGSFEVKENGRMWTGMKYGDPVSVSIVHWCDPLPGPRRSIERVGRDAEAAIASWNLRSK